MNGFGGRIKNVRGRVPAGLLVLSVAGSLMAVPNIAAAKPGPPTPPSQSQSGSSTTSTSPTSTDPAGSISGGKGHKVK
jgi:hypothetical protein